MSGPDGSKTLQNNHRCGTGQRGQCSLTVVVDHDSGNLVWAAPGREYKTMATFFDLLGDDGCVQVELVSADAAEWIERTVYDRCPKDLCGKPASVISIRQPGSTRAVNLANRGAQFGGWLDGAPAVGFGQEVASRGLMGSRRGMHLSIGRDAEVALGGTS